MLPVVLATLVAVVASEGLTAPELQHAASIGQMLDIAAGSDMPALYNITRSRPRIRTLARTSAARREDYRTADCPSRSVAPPLQRTYICIPAPPSH